MATIDSIPNEILAQIFEYLKYDASVEAISLTSKRFSAVVTPVLFALVSTENEYAINRFFMAVLKKPVLTGYVESFHASTNAEVDEDTEPALNVDISHLSKFKVLKTRVRNKMPVATYSKKFCARWHEAIFSGQNNWDAVVAWLIQLCSMNLATLKMNLLGIQKCRYIDKVLSHAEKSQMSSPEHGFLSKLQRVVLEKHGRYEQETGIEIRFVIPYLRISSVRVVRISGLREDDNSNASTIDNDVKFATEDLTIIDSYLNSESIRGFLKHFPALKRFSYGYAAPTTRVIEMFDPMAVTSALRNSRHCLEKLALTKSRPYEDSGDDDSYDELMGDVNTWAVENFDGFETLRDLEIGIDILLGIEEDEADDFLDGDSEVDSVNSSDLGSDIENHSELSWDNDDDVGKASDCWEDDSVHASHTAYSLTQQQDFESILPHTLEVLTLHEVRNSFTDLLPVLWSRDFRDLRPGFTTLRVSNGGASRAAMEEWRSRAEKRGLIFEEVSQF